MVGPFHCSIDDKRHKGQNIAEQVKFNLVFVVGGLEHVLDGHEVCHQKTQEKEAHNLAIEV